MKSYLESILFWPADAFQSLWTMNLVELFYPVVGGVTAYALARNSGTRNMQIAWTYLGAGAAHTVGSRMGMRPLAKSSAAPSASDDDDSKANQPSDNQTLFGEGPLGNHPLRPITRQFQEMPPIPRYPLAASSHYALFQERGWNEGNMSGQFSGLMQQN